MLKYFLRRPECVHGCVDLIPANIAGSAENWADTQMACNGLQCYSDAELMDSMYYTVASPDACHLKLVMVVDPRILKVQ